MSRGTHLRVHGERDEQAVHQPEGYIVDGNGDVHLHSAEALAWFSVVSNGLNGQEVDDFNGKKVTLETNVDMSAAIWTPISERIDASSFKGIFNGNEHIIDGIQLTKTNLYAYKSGFFGNVFEATISNIVPSARRLSAPHHGWERGKRVQKNSGEIKPYRDVPWRVSTETISKQRRHIQRQEIDAVFLLQVGGMQNNGRGKVFSELRDALVERCQGVALRRLHLDRRDVVTRGQL